MEVGPEFGGRHRERIASRSTMVIGKWLPAFLDADDVGVELTDRGRDIEWLPVKPEAAVQVQARHSELVDVRQPTLASLAHRDADRGAHWVPLASLTLHSGRGLWSAQNAV